MGFWLFWCYVHSQDELKHIRRVFEKQKVFFIKNGILALLVLCPFTKESSDITVFHQPQHQLEVGNKSCHKLIGWHQNGWDGMGNTALGNKWCNFCLSRLSLWTDTNCEPFFRIGSLFACQILFLIKHFLPANGYHLFQFCFIVNATYGNTPGI